MRDIQKQTNTVGQLDKQIKRESTTQLATNDRKNGARAHCFYVTQLRLQYVFLVSAVLIYQFNWRSISFTTTISGLIYPRPALSIALYKRALTSWHFIHRYEMHLNWRDFRKIMYSSRTHFLKWRLWRFILNFLSWHWAGPSLNTCLHLILFYTSLFIPIHHLSMYPHFIRTSLYMIHSLVEITFEEFLRASFIDINNRRV